MQEKLIILRLERGLSKIFMGKLIGRTAKQYAQKEKGLNQFTANEMFTIANYFEKKIEDIFLPTFEQIS